MKASQYFKIFILALFFILNLLFTNKIFAATLTLDSSKSSLGVGEQFYVDLMLDPQGESVNTIRGSITFPGENISFIRAEEGQSIVNLWVEEPKLDKGTISFAGVISNGFGGVIDPFNPTKKLPGLIIRLVFEPTKPGSVDFSTSVFYLNLNDGLGTEIEAPAIFGFVDIGNFTKKVKYENKVSGIPELEVYVTRDHNIFNNKYVLVFKARDKETGIKSVVIKEGRGDWKEIESPYLLKDQSRHSNITLQATNLKGESVSINIDKIPYDWKFFVKISVIIIIVIVLFTLIIKRLYAKRK